jgi:truncated hemoglobin YjbI
MVEDLFDLIGGRSTIEAATELFYDKVLQDDRLRQFFERVDMAHLRSRHVTSRFHSLTHGSHSAPARAG